MVLKSGSAIGRRPEQEVAEQNAARLLQRYCNNHAWPHTPVFQRHALAEIAWMMDLGMSTRETNLYNVD